MQVISKSTTGRSRASSAISSTRVLSHRGAARDEAAAEVGTERQAEISTAEQSADDVGRVALEDAEVLPGSVPNGCRDRVGRR
jgi:hypothetical protein